jgi:hypothetical protein
VSRLLYFITYLKRSKTVSLHPKLAHQRELAKEKVGARAFSTTAGPTSLFLSCGRPGNIINKEKERRDGVTFLV